MLLSQPQQYKERLQTVLLGTLLLFEHDRERAARLRIHTVWNTAARAASTRAWLMARESSRLTAARCRTSAAGSRTIASWKQGAWQQQSLIMIPFIDGTVANFAPDSC